MSILFNELSESGAALAGELRFSKSRGLSASVSFLPLPLFHFLALASFLAWPKPIPWSFFAPKPNRNAYYTA